MKINSKFRQILSLLICLLLMIAVAARRDKRLFGHDLGAQQSSTPTSVVSIDTMVVLTANLSSDVVGYGGVVPLKITIVGDRVASVEALENSETPRFFARVERDIIPRWDGLKIDEALDKRVDALSGATYSSKAVIESVRRGLEFAQGVQGAASQKWDWSWKLIITLVVLLSAAIVPLFVHSKVFRTVQLVLNVAVLGFWSGSFISYSLMLNYLSNGAKLYTALVPLIMLAVAFIFPLFGHNNHYCNSICPLGSLQELLGRCVKYKIPLKPRLVRSLDLVRRLLWAVLMVLMLCGVAFDWVDYEPFTAFLFGDASVVVLIIAATVVVLSTLIMRPYCRFVCPTGTLFKESQNLH